MLLFYTLPNDSTAYSNLENFRHQINFLCGQIHENLLHEIILARITSYV